MAGVSAVFGGGGDPSYDFRATEVERDPQQDMSSLDWVDLEFLRGRDPGGKGYRATKCALRGAGWLFECARLALRRADVEIVTDEEDSDESTLVLVVSDWGDHDFFRREHEKALRNGQRVTFFTRSGLRLVAGPLVAPHQSACFECYWPRPSSAVPLPHEAVEHDAPSSERGPLGAKTPCPLVRGLVEFVIARHVLAAMRDWRTVAELGVVESLDGTTLKRAARYVFRFPQCAICGTSTGHTMNPAFGGGNMD